MSGSKTLPIEKNHRPSVVAVFDEIDQAIHARLSLEDMLDRTLAALKQLLPFTSAAIDLWDPQAEQLVVRSCVGSMTQLDKGYAAQIARDREPLLVVDALVQPKLEGDPLLRSYIGVPVLLGAKLIAVLELSSDQTGAFSTEDLAALRLVASHTAVAIESIRLHSEALLRADEMTTMSTLSAAINASLNLDELLEIIVYSVSQAIECDRSAVFLMDNERGVLNLAKSRGLSQDFIRRNQNIRPELGAQAQVILDRYPLVMSNIRQAETRAKFLSLLEREGISAFADLPLRGREHVLGALTVYYDRPHTFDESELELLQAIANQVTLALENARLYERTDRALARRVDQLAAIEEIGRELTSTLDITRVFNVVLQRAVGSTGASAGFLALRDSASGELELIVDHGYPSGTLERFKAEGWPMSHGIVERVARTGETALVNDVEVEPHYVAHLPTTCAQLIVPIKKEARVLGVLSLESSRSQGFSPDDARFITQLAELAAIAIDNARLFQQVREGRDNLQAILDSTRDGVLVIDRDNRVVLANPMVEEMTGLAAEALVGGQVSALVCERDERILALLGYSADEVDLALGLLDTTSNQVTKRTYEILAPAARHIEQVASPVMDKDGAVVGRLIVLRDVTEEHQLASMRQNMTDMIIHDLRSPLTAVIGGVQVASDLTEALADPAAIQHALDLAHQSCGSLMSLVDSLLDISRLEAGQMPLERQPVLLPKLAQSVIQQMRPLAERETVTLELQTAAGISPVDVDQELISRVLVNLVENALKYSSRNSTVTVQIAPEAVAREQGLPESETMLVDSIDSLSRSVRCTVLDTGPGIPSEYRKRVFERFAQLDDRRKGKGLGLAFCELAVQAHGGRIWVTDNPSGQGSAFSFTLPIVSPEFITPGSSDATG